MWPLAPKWKLAAELLNKVNLNICCIAGMICFLVTVELAIWTVLASVLWVIEPHRQRLRSPLTLHSLSGALAYDAQASAPCAITMTAAQQWYVALLVDRFDTKSTVVPATPFAVASLSCFIVNEQRIRVALGIHANLDLYAAEFQYRTCRTPKCGLWPLRTHINTLPSLLCGHFISDSPQHDTLVMSQTPTRALAIQELLEQILRDVRAIWSADEFVHLSRVNKGFQATVSDVFWRDPIGDKFRPMLALTGDYSLKVRVFAVFASRGCALTP